MYNIHLEGEGNVGKVTEDLKNLQIDYENVKSKLEMAEKKLRKNDTKYLKKKLQRKEIAIQNKKASFKLQSHELNKAKVSEQNIQKALLDTKEELDVSMNCR